jgi:hypothetical protein
MQQPPQFSMLQNGPLTQTPVPQFPPYVPQRCPNPGPSLQYVPVMIRRFLVQVERSPGSLDMERLRVDDEGDVKPALRRIEPNQR